MVVDKQLRELQLASKLGLQYSVAIERGRRPSADLKDRHHEQPRIGGVLKTTAALTGIAPVTMARLEHDGADVMVRLPSIASTSSVALTM